MVSGKNGIAVSCKRGVTMLLFTLLPGVGWGADVDQIIDEISNQDRLILPIQGLHQPTIDESKKVLDKHGINIEALQNNALQMQNQLTEQLGISGASQIPENASRPSSRLLIFVSLSMPAASIQRVLDDASRTGAIVVLNGMDRNSMKATKEAIKEVNGQRQVGWQIDPVSAKNFGVNVVPTTILAMSPVRKESCDEKNEGKCVEELFYGIEGDVSIEYALEKMVEMAPMSKKEAGKYLARIRDGKRGGT